MKAAELKDLSPEALAEKENDLRRELFNLRFQRSTGEIQNPMRIRAVRKDIARVLTAVTANASKGKG